MDYSWPLFLQFPVIAGIGELEIPGLSNCRRQKLYLPRRDGIDTNFKSLYRFSRENVNFLASTFLDESSETRGGALNNVQRMKCFLRYVGDPGFQVTTVATVV